MFRNNITEAGCQRGTDDYQCWLPLQLKSCNIGTRMHKKNIKKKNTASIQADKSASAEREKKKFLLIT